MASSAQLAWPRPPISLRRPALDRTRVKESLPLAGLLALAAALYLWGLSHNGYANQYYAAAVQAGTHSWKAFLFGSLDAANYITVDKPPASLWMMELSSRLFGFSSFSLLLPQAIEGVASVALLYATVRRWFGRPAALLSGLILALTPVAAMMFSFDNPDALLVALLVLSAYGVTRALENGATRWLAMAGAALGLAFLTKEMQAFLVLPGLALAYLVAAPVRLRRRLWQLAVAGGAVVLSAGWWLALVELWPAASRPYVGGSTDNSILQVIFGFNGLDRLSGGGGGPGIGFSGPAGFLRLFDSQLGGEISWLLPAAVVSLLAGSVWAARRPHPGRTRSALIMWGGWLVVTVAVYSAMTGVIHPYYTNTLAPPIAVLVGVGTTLIWRQRERFAARACLAAMLCLTAILAFGLLDRTPDWQPWLRWTVLVAGLGVAAGILIASRVRGRAATALAVAGLAASLAAPAAYTLNTAAHSRSGPNPSAGPLVASAAGFGPRAAGFGPRAAGFGPPPGGHGPAAGGFGSPPGSGRLPPFAGGAFGSARALTDKALVKLLDRDSSRYTWVAATDSAQTGASLELSTGKPVMAIGGFSGRDPAITLARFKRLVAEGRIHYYLAGGGLGAGPGFSSGRFSPPAPPGARGNTAASGRSGYPGRSAKLFPGPPSGAGPFRRGAGVTSSIESWVTSHFRSFTVGGTKVYDLGASK